MIETISLLIVEDKLDDLLLFEEVMDAWKEVHVDLQHADRLEAAKQFARTKEFDAAIIDLSLPDSYGLDTFLSFHEACPLLPTIIMTGARDQQLAIEAVQKGAQDYLFKGEPSPASIIRTIRYAIERQRLTTELKMALDKVQLLEGMLPICASCKKIRDDSGYWEQIETYIKRRSNVKFSHGICPDCAKKLYPKYMLKVDDKKR